MSDCHKGQLKAITEIFPDTVKLRCYFHLIQNIQRLAKNHKVKGNIDYILWVTKTIKESKNSSEFCKTWELLKPELLKMTNQAFIESYEDNHINSQAKWYAGASFIGKQKTNNSLESINRYLKDNWTQRSSRTVPEFFTIMKACFSYYNQKCEIETCMPAETRNRRKIFAKSEDILKKKQIFQIFPHLYAFIRLPKRFKKKKETREVELSKRLDKVEERINFIKTNLNHKFDDLPTFTKIQGFFQYFNFNEDICSCNSFMNTGCCKHQIATLVFLKKIKNPYNQRLNEPSQVRRPRNLQNL